MWGCYVSSYILVCVCMFGVSCSLFTDFGGKGCEFAGCGSVVTIRRCWYDIGGVGSGDDAV